MSNEWWKNAFGNGQRIKPGRPYNPTTVAGSFEQRLAGNGQGHRIADQQFGAAPTDPFQGKSLLDLLDLSSFNNDSTRNNGGGGGKSAAQAAADLKAQQDAYAQMLKGLAGQGAAINASYGTRKGTIASLSKANQKKLDGILQGMKAEYLKTGKSVAGAYAGGDRLQADLARQFADASAGRAAAQGRTLSAFGANPMAVDRQYGAADLLAAQRSALAAAGTADAGTWAAAPGVATMLMGDIKTNNSQQQTALLAALAAAKQKSDADQAKAKSDLIAQAAAAGVKL